MEDKKKSKELLKYLKAHHWLDVRSRALFVEVTTYNAQVNLFTAINLIVEFLPTGGMEKFSSLRIARLYTYGGSKFTVTCQFFVLLFMGMFFYKETKKIYREKRSYFNGFWNMVEFAMIILIVTSIIIFFSRSVLVNQAIKSIHDNPGQFVSFNKVVQWDTLFSAVSSIVVFLACIKALKLLQYNKTISILASTLQGSAKPLAGFSVIFIIFFLAFTIQAYLMFMPQIEKFSTFVTTTETVMGFLLGDFNFQEIETTKPIYGRMWFILLVLFGSFYIMNIFLAIIMDTYSNVRADIMLQNQEYQIVEFMVNKFKYVIGKGDGGKKALLDEINQKEERQKEGKHDGPSHSSRQKKVSKKVVSFTNETRKKYYKMLDDEIEKKFEQLDDSLDGFWMEVCNEEKSRVVDDHGCGIFGNQSPLPTLPGNSKPRCPAYDNPCFVLQEEQAELLMQKELAEELSRWS